VRLFDEADPAVAAGEGERLFGDHEHARVGGGVIEVVGVEFGAVLDGAEDDVGAGDFVDGRGGVDVDARAEEEVDDAFFEDAGGGGVGVGLVGLRR
jgi:hypothetical protein